MGRTFKKTMTIVGLARKYKVSQAKILSELKKGIKVEKEHTTKVTVAKTIALHHLAENLNYYNILKKVKL